MTRCDQCGHLLDEQAVSTQPATTDDPTPPTALGELESDGPPKRCPSCGTELGEKSDEGDEEIHPKAPWHFKVLIVGSVVYLGWRLYQGIGWLIHHA